MIKYMDGDIFDSKCMNFILPVACYGINDEDIHKKYVEHFSDLRKMYSFCSKKKLLHIGDSLILCIGENDENVILMPVKVSSEDDVTYFGILDSLRDIATKIRRKEIVGDIAMPAIRCNIDWDNKVVPLLNEYLGPIDTVIEVYEV